MLQSGHALVLPVASSQMLRVLILWVQLVASLALNSHCVMDHVLELLQIRYHLLQVLLLHLHLHYLLRQVLIRRHQLLVLILQLRILRLLSLSHRLQQCLLHLPLRFQSLRQHLHLHFHLLSFIVPLLLQVVVVVGTCLHRLRVFEFLHLSLILRSQSLDLFVFVLLQSVHLVVNHLQFLPAAVQFLVGFLIVQLLLSVFALVFSQFALRELQFLFQ